MNLFHPAIRSTAAFAALGLAAFSSLAAAERGSASDESVLKNETARRDAQSASRLIGATVKTEQNEKVGKVEDLLLDFASGRVVGVILSTGGFLGMGDTLSVVQPSNLSRAADDELRIDLTREKLAAAPRYEREKGDAGDRIRDRWSGATGETRGRRDRDSDPSARTLDRPVSVADADNTARNRRDRDPSLSVDPLDQGNSRSDVEITAKIRSAIVDNERLSTNAKNVKIVTRDGQVTLRGPVNSEDEKRVIADIASKAAPGRVSNQIEVAAR